MSIISSTLKHACRARLLVLLQHFKRESVLCSIPVSAFLQYMLKQIGSDETLKFQRGFLVSAEREQMLNVCSMVQITFSNPLGINRVWKLCNFWKQNHRQDAAPMWIATIHVTWRRSTNIYSPLSLYSLIDKCVLCVAQALVCWCEILV